MPGASDVLVYMSLVSGALIVLARTPPAWDALNKMFMSMKTRALADLYERVNTLEELVRTHHHDP